LGLPHVLALLGWTEMEGSTKKSFVSSLSRGQAAHLVPGLCAHWHSEHSEQQPRDILQAGARVPPRIHEWYFVIVLICLFVSWILGPLSSPEISSLYLSRAHTRSRPFQGAPFSMAGFLASALAAWAGPETLPVCDLVALWLEGERMKGRGARNTHHLLKKTCRASQADLRPFHLAVMRFKIARTLRSTDLEYGTEYSRGEKRFSNAFEKFQGQLQELLRVVISPFRE
jgi:hypothetical protein